VMGADLFELANNHIWRTEFLNKSWTADVLPKDWEIETDPQGYTERGWIDWGFKTYYAYLNCGFRMRPTGGTGSGYHPVPAGFGRVYVECPDGVSYEKWMEGLNAGRSFVSTGPMFAKVTINGQPLGTIFKDSKNGSYDIEIEAEVGSVMTNQMTDVQLIVNGEVRQSFRNTHVKPSPGKSSSGDDFCLFHATFKVNQTSWVALRIIEYRDVESATSENPMAIKPTDKSRFRYAHTAPVYFEIDGPIKPRKREVNYFIERMVQEIARNTGILADDEVAEYRKALEIYREIAQRAVE